MIIAGVAHHTEAIRTAAYSLEAAVGNVSVSVLRVWQREGGFSRVFSMGDSGIDVGLLQRSLATDPNLYPEGKITGYFGISTEQALERFQAEYRLPVSGTFAEATREKFNQIFFNQLCPTPTSEEPDLSLAHVTRDNGLPIDYISQNLTTVPSDVLSIGVICVTQSTAMALQTLVAAAARDSIALAVCSGYRGPDVQGFLMQQYMLAEGGKASREVALPYHSEHQTGTAVDLTGLTDGYGCAQDDFGSTPESVWLTQNAWKYGFNLSYPQTRGNGQSTQYIYEPWHWRYVGGPLAAMLHAQGISFVDMNVMQAALYSVATTTKQLGVQ